jgi:[CysO sulfur-carrier protein]-S-L-cysteine hydrolase
MTEQPIQLPRHLVNQILHLAQLSPDHDIAGLVGAKDGLARSCHLVKRTGSTLDPRERDQALKAIRSRGETLMAVLHSHPAAPAEPLASDLHCRDFPEALRLIISLNTKGVLELRGFRIDENLAVRENALLLTE